MRNKICVYAICKNESAFVDRWMDSMSEADEVVVTDTGSEDGTAEKLRRRGAVVYEELIQPWRFDTARNISLSHVPEDADICVCTDLDEVMEPGWRNKLEAAWEPSCTRGRYLFTSEFNPDGTPRKQFAKEKIHKRKDFKWVKPVHEVLEYSGAAPDKTVFIDGLIINHYPDRSKPRSQYLPLLKLSAEENPADGQTAFWLGREYFFHGNHECCIEALKNYLTLPGWNEERSAAMGLIADSYKAMGKAGEVKPWLFRAIAECCHRREPYLKAVRFAYTQKDWPFVFCMVKSGLALKPSGNSYLADSDCQGSAFYDLGAISAYRLGLFAESRSYAIKALELEPENPRLKNNLHLIEEKINCGEGKGGCKNESI